MSSPLALHTLPRSGCCGPVVPNRPSKVPRERRHLGGPPSRLVTPAGRRAGALCSASKPSAAGSTKPPSSKSLVLRVEDPLAGRPYRPAQVGDEPDFWEGSQWDLFGFVAQYLWAFGIVLAAAASLYAVSSYSQGETEAPPQAPVAIQAEQSPQGQTLPEIQPSLPDLEDDAPPL